MNTYVRAALAVGVGASLIVAFQPYDVWIVAIVAVGGFALLVRDQPIGRAGLLGLLTGLGFFIPFLVWTGDEVGPIPWLLLGVSQALFFVPLGIGTMLAQRLPGWPVWTAAVWVADEALRGRLPWGGFTWGKLAFSQVDGPMLGLAGWGGSVLVTFGVAVAGGLLAWAALRRPAWQRAGAVAAAAGVVAIGLGMPGAAPNGDRVTVAVVQGNTPGQGLDFNARRRVILDNHVEATHSLAADVASGAEPAPDLVIWPENSSDINPFSDGAAFDDIDGAVRAIGVPTLIGTIVPTADERNVENTAVVWDPVTGPGQTYVKRHPMPFGEYIPFRSIAERIAPDAVARQPRDFVAGDEVGVLDVAGVAVGAVICFEVAFDGLVSDAVRGGAEILAVQTNNAGFGYSPMTEQQLAMSRLRAVEHGRPTLVAALAGVSAVIDRDGQVTDRLELFTQGVMVAEIEPSDDTTVATAVGGWPEVVLTAGALGAVLLAGRRPRRSGPAGSGSVPAESEAVPVR